MTIEKLDSAFSFVASFMEIYHKEEKKLPYHINLIDELHADENAHSRILEKLLQQETPENNRFEILESFLRYLKKKSNSFYNITIENPRITQEVERIDLWIRDKTYAIIIENKIRWAKDQSAQIERYIDTTKQKNFAEEQIYVIYLPPIYEKEPEEQSWGKYSDSEMRKKRYVSLSFREDVLNWLKEDVLPNVKIRDIYLKGAIEQYIDHLEGMFSLRTINNQMNMELQNFIKKELKIQKNKPDDALEILAAKKEELENAIEQIELLEEHTRKNICQTWAKQLEKDFHETSYKLCLLYNEEEVGINIPSSGVTIYTHIGFKEGRWHCTIWNTNNSDIPAFIVKKVGHLLEDYNPKDKNWRRRRFDTYKECYPILTEVVEALTKK